MFDFIRKRYVWELWDSGLAGRLETTADFELKSIQDLVVYAQLAELSGKRVAEIGAGNSRVLPALCEANECVAVDQLAGESGGPTRIKPLPNVEQVRAYLGDNAPALEASSFGALCSISVKEHVPNHARLAAFDGDQLRILRPGGIFVHAIDIYLAEEPAAHQVLRFETYRNWVASSPGVQPLGAVYSGPCRFTPDLATNPDNIMHLWGNVNEKLIGLRQEAQCASVILGGRKISDTRRADGRANDVS